MTGLGLGLPKLIISSSYSHRLMLHVLGQGLDHSVQVQVLSYPVKANRFRVWLMHCPGWTSAGFARGPPPLSTALQAQHSALLTLHVRPPSSLQLEFPVSVLPSPLPASSCNSSQQPSSDTKVFEKIYPSMGFYPSFTQQPWGLQHRNNMGLLECIQRSHEDDLRAGAPLLWG